MQYLSLLLGASALLAPVFAQTFTSCNPMNTTCPNDPALGLNHTFYFNTSTTVTDSFNITAGSLNYGVNGTEFTINKQGDSPTIQSKFYIFFGSVSVIMRAASGQGIISSIVLESDDLDEVDWEFMGGNGSFAETNYFGKGNTTSFDRAIYYPVSSDVRENFHNYTTHWTSSELQWYIDSVLVRTLAYGDANGGYDYPQTPMTVRLGIWAGGDPTNSKGTIEWAGGVSDFSNAPFTMYVQSATINDFSTGSAYTYSDHTGSWESIKVVAGNSTAAKTIIAASTPSLSVAQKFAALPQGTKLAIYAGSGAAGALFLIAFLVTCIRQRRKGRREREAYNAKVEKERELAYQDQMELREKGLGGWDKGSYATQGDDALGGWGGSHVTPGAKEHDLADDFSQRSTTPGLMRVGSPALQPLARLQSPPLVSPIPHSPRMWNGGNESGLIQNAGNAYTGGYGGNTNIPRSPSFPISPTSPQEQQRGYTGGYSSRGYQRF